MGKHRKFSADLKAKIAVEALKGQRTVQEIAAKLQRPSNSSHQLEKATVRFRVGSVLDGTVAIGPARRRIEDGTVCGDRQAEGRVGLASKKVRAVAVGERREWIDAGHSELS